MKCEPLRCANCGQHKPIYIMFYNDGESYGDSVGNVYCRRCSDLVDAAIGETDNE